MSPIKRPKHLQLSLDHCQRLKNNSPSPSRPMNLSTLEQQLPSRILPHLFVGSLDHTKRDLLAKLNISYILSLGSLPLVIEQVTSAAITPTPPSSSSNQPATKVCRPARDCVCEFHVRLERQTISPPSTSSSSSSSNAIGTISPPDQEQSQDTSSCLLVNNENQRNLTLVKCKCINVADTCDSQLGPFFDECHQFIEEARLNKCNVLVHCLAGLSRSATIAIAHVMRLKSLCMRDAYALVKCRRPQIDPNLGFIGQLVAYDKTTTISPSLSASASATKTVASMSQSPVLPLLANSSSPCRSPNSVAANEFSHPFDLDIPVIMN